ncbi:MAG TPA: bifunctional phosphoglucose/phosphomannose isomerase [Balneolales bacterium]|nr:bifunctional phosphoglucose/phosphomannose isomerase [Balneolales bacterium]
MVSFTEKIIREIDSEGMWDHLCSFPDHWNNAIKVTKTSNLNIDSDQFKNVLIAGMGGSAIGGDLIKAFAEDENQIPVYVNRHYKLPNWVDNKTLCIVSSYSGDTEETLQCFDEARSREAKIIGITSGGQLLDKVRKFGCDYVKMPERMSPRAALAYSFIPMYFIFQKAGLIEADEDQLKQTAVFLGNQVDKFSNFIENEALSLAFDIQDTLPIIYSDGGLMEPVNLRWRGQFEENAKTLAFGNLLPEMNHNEIVGWDQIAHLTGRLSVIMLSDKEDNPRVTQRMSITKDLISEQANGCYVLKTQGDNKLSRLFSLIQFADWTSIYLALINRIDPTPTPKIDLLKRKLAEV